MKVDEMMPLHVNMELLNFVSFSKGCYVGQELLTRTKHRGAVRRRFFIAVAADYGSSEGGKSSGCFGAARAQSSVDGPLHHIHCGVFAARSRCPCRLR